MKIQLRHFPSRLLRLFQSLSRTPGFALVISLLVMMALALLGLTLLLLSNTEKMISLNERDSTVALYNAEGALQVAKQIALRIASVANDFTYLLNGADDDPLTTYDNGVMKIRSVNPAITRQDLDNNCEKGSTTCEAWMSVIETIDSVPYEVYRVGVDRDGSTPKNTSGWDGPRGLLYVRVEDNHDEDPLLNDPVIDKDNRIRIIVISEYPIFVDDAGREINPKASTFRTVGVSKRKLIVRFGPTTSKGALYTNGNMTIGGSLDVCGDCGAAHANQRLTIDHHDVDLCSDATSSAGPPIRSDNGSFQSVHGIVTQTDTVNIPIANPFHENYVPQSSWFNTSVDPELTGFPQLQCPPWHATNNPGGTRYFALVGDGADGRVLKAYWRPDLTPSQWKWEEIDILKDGNNTVLDDCGRLVDDGAGGSIHAPDTNAGTDGHSAINDGTDNAFYGFDFADSGGPRVTCNASDDQSLSGTEHNDYGIDSRIPSISGVTYMLPGTSGPAEVPDGAAHKDSNADFIPANAMKSNENKWGISGNNVWSPLYNAIIFVYGNLDLTGSPGKLCYSADTPPCTTALPSGVWRATFVVFNNITTRGSPAYAPFRSVDAYPDYQYLFVAGRDLELSGNFTGGSFCPASCSDVPLSLANYSGVILAHEQIQLTGDVTVNGVIMSEDAASCSANVTSPGLDAGARVQVYYNCLNPIAPFRQSVGLVSWEEIQ